MTTLRLWRLLTADNNLRAVKQGRWGLVTPIAGPCIANCICSFRPKDTPSLRALGSKWARLLDNLPGVSQFYRCAGCLSGKTYGIKISAGHSGCNHQTE